MKKEVRIYVSKYLDWLNEQIDYLIKWHKLDSERVKKIDVKTIAANLEVPEYTIKHITNYSSYELIRGIAGEILDAYYAYFDYDYFENIKEYPDEMIDPRDISYVIHYLCDYYDEDFFNYQKGEKL